MSKITTENCKEFLVNYFKTQGQDTLIKDWKRTSKYKKDNLVLRDFNHPVIGDVVIAENHGVLSIDNSLKVNSTTSTKKQSKATSEYMQRIFSAKETKEAETLVKKWVQNASDEYEIGDENIDYDDEKDKLIHSQKWLDYQFALPSQFYFCFPNDTYGNDSNSVTNGLDTSMFPNGKNKESFNVVFTDKAGSDIDLYANHILKISLLPEWADFCDEYHLDFNSEAPDMTVKEWVQFLLKMGFEYKDDDCLFADYLNDINITTFTESSNEKDKILKNISTINNIFKKDDSEELLKMINNGLDIDKILSNNKYLIDHAYSSQAYKCGKVLLEAGVNLWQPIVRPKYEATTIEFASNGVQYVIDDSENRTIASSIADVVLQQTSDEELFFNLLETNLPVKKSIEKYSTFLNISSLLGENDKFFQKSYQTLQKFLSPKETTQVLVKILKKLNHLNQALFKDTILNANEDDYRKELLQLIDYDKNIVLAALNIRPINIKHDKIQGKTIYDKLNEDVKTLTQDITRRSKGFIMVSVYPDGTRVSDLDRYKERFYITSTVLSLVNQIDAKEQSKNLRP